MLSLSAAALPYLSEDFKGSKEEAPLLMIRLDGRDLVETIHGEHQHKTTLAELGSQGTWMIVLLIRVWLSRPLNAPC